MDDDEKNDEVTFLLRLRPTPPLRRKRCSDIDIKPNVSVHTTAPKGWDVVIEQKKIDDKKPSLSSLRSRRLSHDYQNEACSGITYTSTNWDVDLISNRDGDVLQYSPSREINSKINREPPEIKPRTSSLENSDRKISLLKDIFSSPKLRRRRNSVDNRKFSQLTSCFGDKSSSNTEEINCTDVDRLHERKTKSSSPPPLPPRFRPSAPPQELVDSIVWHPKPYFPIYHPYFTPNVMPHNVSNRF